MGPALVAAFSAIGVALIMAVIGPLVTRWLSKGEDDLDVVHALSSFAAEQAALLKERDVRILDLEQRLHACEIRAAECEARERSR